MPTQHKKRLGLVDSSYNSNIAATETSMSKVTVCLCIPFARAALYESNRKRSKTVILHREHPSTMAPITKHSCRRFLQALSWIYKNSTDSPKVAHDS